MATIRQQISHNSGIPLGGIGAGTVEIRPDGLFHEWQIFNTGVWSPKSPQIPQAPLECQDLVFMIRFEQPERRPVVRYLALREQLHDLYSFPWLKCVESISFDGRFPAAILSYQDEDLPLIVEAEVFGPFVPHDSRASGTPGFYIAFRVKNTSGARAQVSIVGVLRNAAGARHGRTPRNRATSSEGTLTIELGADGLAPEHSTTGGMAFAAQGGELSCISGTFHVERPGLVYHGGSRYGMKVYSCLHGFRDTGELNGLSPETAPSLPEGFSAAHLSDAEVSAQYEELLKHPVFFNQAARLRHALPDLDSSPALQRDFLDDAVRNLDEIALRGGEWGDAWLCSRHHLRPEHQVETVFAVSWFFPNHYSPGGPRMGHRYETFFSGAADVSAYLMQNRGRLKRATLGLRDAIYDSSLPEEAADAVSGQLSTLTKCTWWTKAGHFGVWEGLGCCGFHTTDITYQGSFPIISLFPDLQKMQMTHGARFQRGDGRVHHLFTPDFENVDEGFDRVDMNQQFVMLAARDYLWSGDRAYLDELWPHIIRAMESTAELDGDGDGLPDRDTRRNTYDVWDFQGCPSYIGSLWLGALKAAVRLAEEMGDTERAEHWRETYDRALESFEEKLWNGRYYILWKDEQAGLSDECCMSDQLSGDWFSAVSGWGGICDPERVERALLSVMEHNFVPDTGLINASYPPGCAHRLATSGNYQQEATWTGIEYTVAALLIHLGRLLEGMSIVSDIHKRHLRTGRCWNHVECGNHYYRAMSSWTLLLAFSGFRLDVPRREMGFEPRTATGEWHGPFFAPGVWGYLSQIPERVSVEVRGGSVALERLSLPVTRRMADVKAHLDGAQAPCAVSGEGTVSFQGPLELAEGSVLVVEGKPLPRGTR